MKFKFIKEYQLEQLQCMKEEGWDSRRIEEFAKGQHYGFIDSLIILRERRPLLFGIFQFILIALTSAVITLMYLILFV